MRIARILAFFLIAFTIFACEEALLVNSLEAIIITAITILLSGTAFLTLRRFQRAIEDNF
jgi:positive regulator of sigma E activity